LSAQITSFSRLFSPLLYNKQGIQTGIWGSVEITNKMQTCNRIYYSTVHWRLKIFWAAHRSSSGALNVFAASGLHTNVVTGRSQVWVGTEFPLRLDYGRSPHAYINQRLEIQLELLMMSGVPLETCWAFNKRWNNKFYYKVASCWLFLLRTLCFARMLYFCVSYDSYNKQPLFPYYNVNRFVF
jgi:hypothetical protein